MRNVPINPISPRTRALLDCPTIASQFPIRFKDGGGFPMFNAYCAQCNDPLDHEHIRGNVTMHNDDTAIVDAAGACMKCKIATPVNYRFHSDGTATGISPRDAKWTAYRPSIGRRLLMLLFPKTYTCKSSTGKP